MANFTTELVAIEDRIKAEYNKIDAFIALHPKISVLGAFVLALFIGHFV